MNQLSRISQNITVITIVISAILGAAGKPHNQNVPPPALFDSDSLWMNPCSMASYNNSFTTTRFTNRQRAENLERIKNAIIRTRQEIEHITIESGENTDWNSKAEKYTFLEPYKKNQTTWEPRLQVYLASIQVIYLKQVKLDNDKNEDQTAGKKLEELRKQAKQLLCDIQEYRNNSKTSEERNKSTGYTKEQMNSLIKFDVTEESDMDLHKWFLKCRFRCFLNAMEMHVDIMYNRTNRTKATRKVRTTKMPKKKPRKGKKNGKLLRNKCCIVNNKPSSPATPRPPMDRTHNNKKKHNERKQSKNIDQNQKKVQRKGNKKATHKIQM